MTQTIPSHLGIVANVLKHRALGRFAIDLLETVTQGWCGRVMQTDRRMIAARSDGQFMVRVICVKLGAYFLG